MKIQDESSTYIEQARVAERVGLAFLRHLLSRLDAQGVAYTLLHDEVIIGVGPEQPRAQRVTADDPIDCIIAAGYRRTSHKYGLVSRIDRPDWVQHMAQKMHRSPADFYRTMHNKVGPEVYPSWADHYRRCYSQDTLELGPERGKLVPTSCWDACGYVELEP